MRKTLGAVVLVLTLCASISAGDIPCPPAPEPPPSMAVEETTTEGDMQNGDTDALTETVLMVVESVLALL